MQAKIKKYLKIMIISICLMIFIGPTTLGFKAKTSSRLYAAIGATCYTEICRYILLPGWGFMLCVCCSDIPPNNVSCSPCNATPHC